MTKEQHEQKVEEALRDYALEMKKDRDRDTARAYEQKLKSTVKNFRLSAEAFTTGGKKNRALAVGGCILSVSEKLEKESVNHHFVEGSLGWNITEERVKDSEGNKGYRYQVTVVVATDEKAYTAEQIREQVEDLEKRLAAETEEMFSEDEVEITDTQIQ